MLIVALGASNTAGYGVASEAAYPAVLERLLRVRGLAAVVKNAGVAGHTTAQMLARLDRDIPAGTQVVIFQPGSNDARTGVSAADREANIKRVAEALVRRHIPVVRVAAAFDAATPGNLQSDGIHFTERGHELIAEHLIDQVVAALKRGTS